jgi:hypothetical protein
VFIDNRLAITQGAILAPLTVLPGSRGLSFIFSRQLRAERRHVVCVLGHLVQVSAQGLVP